MFLGNAERGITKPIGATLPPSVMEPHPVQSLRDFVDAFPQVLTGDRAQLLAKLRELTTLGRMDRQHLEIAFERGLVREMTAKQGLMNEAERSQFIRRLADGSELRQDECSWAVGCWVWIIGRSNQPPPEL